MYKQKLKKITKIIKLANDKKLKRNAKLIDDFLKSYLKSQKKTELLNPMRYSVLDGGKKLDHL